MSTFVGIPPFSNPLWVAMETLHFHIAHTKVFFEDTLVSHLEGPNEQFGTHENLSWGVQGNLNWMPGYYPVGRFEQSPTFVRNLARAILYSSKHTVEDK